MCCSRALDGRPEVRDLDLVNHETYGSAYAEMLAHDVVVEVCEIGEFGHTSQSSRLGDMATEAMVGRISRHPRFTLHVCFHRAPPEMLF